MKHSKSSTAFLFGLLAIILVSAFSSWFFYNAMDSNYILIADGMEPRTQVLDNYKYSKSQKGLIISLSALASSFFFLIMLIIPDDKKQMTQYEAPLDQEIDELHEMQLGERASNISAEISPETEYNLKAEPAIDNVDIDTADLYEDGFQEVTEGEDDVVYGVGMISAAAIVDFVHKHPDSAIKFLFRKQLDSKPLTTDEDEIYLSWEQRGMTRGKVKAYMLTLMEWDSIPKEPLYELWKKVRDHIFENFS